MENTKAYAKHLDEKDPLASFRHAFLIPEHNGISRTYFLGNSLGLQPRKTSAYIQRVLQQWQDEGVESFFKGENPWLNAHDELLTTMAVIAGAEKEEITIMNQLTVNIHLMLVSFYRPVGSRRKILMEAKAFPSDQYAVRSYIQHLGMNPDEIIVELESDQLSQVLEQEKIIQSIQQIGDELALVFMGGINYYNGQLLPMKEITEAAHQAGALVGFDLAHAMGNVSLSLHDWHVDFACWCSYKYLNGGPGAVAGAFIHKKHHGPDVTRLAGWWGYKRNERFLMESRFVPERDASSWQLSTPSILLYASLKASLDIVHDADWEKMLAKQTLMKQWIQFLLDQQEQNYFSCITPDSRGCQISLLFPQNGKKVYDGLFDKGFMVDWREPNVIRFAPVPLYNSYSEIWNFFEALKTLTKELSSHHTD